ncbi:TetR family transcriptional regulator [Mycolicibacterium gilvum]|uniref:TetR family transcriptional regulator n=1 Tax=Mycolicibacterium gilvum TaxID=1804 RepID=A0A378SGW5_9MYCO|nr:TetR family transcriptional regulator [Mycolicibacterium gilvum]STZ41106.1 TetR family transcriptional regulator [Mycolicibacterium gilvum]
MANKRVRPGKKGVATRARILDSAALTFRNKGYAGTRLSDVAAAANTQAGSLYYHFPSREELVEEVLRVGQERTSGFVRRRVAALPDDASALDRLREAISAHLDTVLEIGDYTAATIRIIGQVPDEIRKRRIHEQREYGEFWRSLVNATQGTDDIRTDLNSSAMRMLLLGAMNSVPEWFRPRADGMSTTELKAQFDSLFLEGLAVHRQATRSIDNNLAAIAVAEEEVLRASRADDTKSEGAQRILDAAAKVFREKGYAGARLADVAAAAGIQTGSMYYYFKSREHLVVEMVLVAWKRTDNLARLSVDALPADATALDRLSTAMAAHLLSVLRNTMYTSALVRILGHIPDTVRDQTVNHQRAYLEYWHGLIEDAIASGEIRKNTDSSVTTMLITGALNWAVEWYHPDGNLSPEELARQVATLVFDGVTKVPAERQSLQGSSTAADRQKRAPRSTAASRKSKVR